MEMIENFNEIKKFEFIRLIFSNDRARSAEG
jgi:hypothetical protein